MSLERYQSVGRFWIGRFFRLYPLYWVVTGGALILFALDRFAAARWTTACTGSGRRGANITMAQEFIGQPHVLGQAWTLSYELVFYFLVSLLFLVKLDHRPGLVLGVGLAIDASASARSCRSASSPQGTTGEQHGGRRRAARSPPRLAAVARPPVAGRRRWPPPASPCSSSASSPTATTRRWFSALLLSYDVPRLGAAPLVASVARSGVARRRSPSCATAATVLLAHGLHFVSNTEPLAPSPARTRGRVGDVPRRLGVFLGSSPCAASPSRGRCGGWARSATPCTSCTASCSPPCPASAVDVDVRRRVARR